MSIFSVSSACKAAEATPGTAAQVLMISARFSDESMFAIAREKCTILQPRATANPQIPIIAIAVNKRISARITTGQIFRELFESSSCCGDSLLADFLLIPEHQSRTLGLSDTRPQQRHKRDGDGLHLQAEVYQRMDT